MKRFFGPKSLELPSFAGAGILWTVIILSAITSLICGSALIICWRMVHWQYQQQSAESRELVRFHDGLILNMQQLVNQSAPMATEDLCQVRFRLRYADKAATPIHSFGLRLSQTRHRAEVTVLDVRASLGTGHVANFGLMPPGNYHLMVTNPLEMESHHRFRVLPGVPVDRVILCPVWESWMREPPAVLDLFLKPAWPLEWENKPILALFHLESGRTKVGGWEWLPPASKRFRYLVPAGNVTERISEAELRELLPASFFDRTELPPWEWCDENPVPVPCRFCEVSGVTLLWDSPANRGRFVHLGTYWFAGSDGSRLPSEFASTDVDTRILSDAPQKLIDRKDTSNWEVEIPRQIVREVIAKLDYELRQ